MKCRNNLCIHNFSKECELEEIEIDWRGNCKNMQYIYISKDTIRSNKLYTQVFLDYKLKFDEKNGNYIYLKSDKSNKE